MNIKNYSKVLTIALFATILSLPAQGSTQVAATTQTQVTHQNSGTFGAGAILDIVPGTWAGRSPSLIYAWQYKASCTAPGSFQRFSLTSGGSPVTSQQLTVPSTIYVDADNQSPFNYTSAISSDGVALLGVASWISGSEFGSSAAGSTFQVGQGFCSGGAGSAAAAPAAAPIKYSGPEFSALSLKPALAGSSATLEGRKLDQISSVTIGGKAAVLSNATDKSVNIGLPAGLTPGVYDLVVTTANHGKLTHMNAIRVREVLPETSLTIKGTGVFTGEEFKKLTSFSRTQNPDMNTVTCIVNSNSEGKSFMQARTLCDRIAATNLNVKSTKIESRSTVESSAIFARVVFSSVE
jgi:hypothetical protein